MAQNGTPNGNGVDINDHKTDHARMDAENMVKRNPHPDFKKVEASRPPFDTSHKWNIKQTVNPNWKLGDGANDGGECLKIPHVEIDPYEAGRPAVYNYKLLISGIIPRPVGFLSTRSKDGKSTNLSPFSYTQMINHDPPLFIIGFAGGFDNAKDSLTNLQESGECVINMISEHFIEAANATSIDAPYGISEWPLSGLTPAECTTVKASRVKEAVFSIEGKLERYVFVIIFDPCRCSLVLIGYPQSPRVREQRNTRKEDWCTSHHRRNPLLGSRRRAEQGEESYRPIRESYRSS
jgi:flavin reductase (DIM6/NTAB) family NADH-FMN oxidoreductase RutF